MVGWTVSWFHDSTVFNLISDKCISENSDSLMCPDQKLRVMKIFFNCIIFIMSLVTGYFYYHVYKLARNLSKENHASQVHLLYQFLPIYTVQLVLFTSFQNWL